MRTKQLPKHMRLRLVHVSNGLPGVALSALPAPSVVVSGKFLKLFSDSIRRSGEDGEGKIWQARGFCKRRIMKITPGSEIRILRLGFPFANRLLLGSRSN